MEPFSALLFLSSKYLKCLTCFRHNYLSSKIFDISYRSNWPISVKTELRLFMTFPTYVLFEKCFHISRVPRRLFTKVNPVYHTFQGYIS